MISQGEALSRNFTVPLFQFLGEPVSLGIDSVALFFASVTLVLGILLCLYSLVETKGLKGRGLFYIYFWLLWLGMTGLVLSEHFLLFYFFWLVTAWAVRSLIALDRAPESVSAADRGFLTVVIGSLPMLAALLFIYGQTGKFSFGELSGFQLNQPLFLLLLAGILSAAALFPFNSWFIRVNSLPASAAAFLNTALLVNTGLYPFIRLFDFVFMPPAPAQIGYLPLFFVIASLLTGLAALRENNLRRFLNCTSISQISLAFLGLAFFSGAGLLGVLIFVPAYLLGKSALFLIAGLIEKQTGERNLKNLGGYFRTQPWLAFLFLVSIFSLAGLPPFLGFWSSHLILAAPFAAQNLPVGFLGVAAGGVTLVYFLHLFYGLFLGREQNPFRQRNSVLQYSSTVALVCFLILLGFWPNVILSLFR